MSKTSIPQKVKINIWVKAHGRCSMCNTPLYINKETMNEINLGEYAHIISDSPDGPRGDAIRSPQLAQEESNIILLCKDDHKLIDSSEHWHEYSAELLLKIKKEHEERINFVTSIKPQNKSHIVVYTANIGEKRFELDVRSLKYTLFPQFYPANLDPVNLGVVNNPMKDSDSDFWSFEKKTLEGNFSQSIPSLIKKGEHISLFAIAPQPLLIYLGTLLGDIQNIEVYQKHRRPDTWAWQESTVENHYEIIEPDDKTKQPVLIIALSGTEIIERVKNQMGNECSYWVLTCQNPNRDMLQSKNQQNDFRLHMFALLERINTSAVGKELFIFPAMPQSCAIELGRLRLPKSDMPWVIWDKPAPEEDYKNTIKIC